MKKLLSILLVVFMMVLSVPFVYAEESNTYKVGDIIQFGSYPQSKVTDSATITALNNKAPAWDNWTSYGYYTGTGSYGTMKQGDWMRYTDIMYNGNKYRGVKFTQYRPHYTYYSSSDNTYQDDNGYSTNTVYWFKFEPIDWRVLDPATGLVMCETIIDSQPYSNTFYSNGGGAYDYFNDSSYTNYASDYETSSIRQWLNTDFYNTAFSSAQQKIVKSTTLNNDGYYTSVGTTGYEKLDSNSTNDKIFLLSYNEVRNSNYGFNSSWSADDPARFAEGSDYARSQGLYIGYNNNSFWFLRSPGGSSDYCCYVDRTGYSYFRCYVSSTSNGVRPALIFNRISDIGQSEHQHDYSSVVTSPTCTAKGYTTYTCECGDTYFADYTDKLEHVYASEITTPATHLAEGLKTFTCKCGDTYTEPVAKLEGHTYETVVIEPTCTAQGYTTYTCECGDSYVDNYTEMLNHEYTSKITTQPTHLTEGVKTYICACGDTYTEAIEKLTVHTYETVVTEPTCTTKGYTTYTCECGDSYVSDYTEMLDHKYTSEITTEPTHLTEGVMTYTCVCGDTYTEAIEKSHTYETVVTEPTCTAKGYTTYTCECGDNYVGDYVDAKGHSYSSTTIQPTCTKSGTVTTFCTNCGDSYTETLEPTGHTFADGNSKCSNCDFDKAKDCSCNCHKNGIVKFFFNIVLFFQKLFRQNQVCNCGIAHY